LMPMPLLTNVGIFNPILMQDIAGGQDRLLPGYAAQLPARLASANLCGSLVGQPVNGYLVQAPVYEAVVRRCLSSRGEVVNRHVRGA